MKKNRDMEKDDDILREEGMTEGPMKFGDMELRPITALSVSWMQRNQVFSNDKDLIWKSAAFVFLHSAPFAEIRKNVNESSLFIDAVDCWLERNVVHHSEMNAIASIMAKAFERYAAASSETSGNGSKN
jgi:hypothetical protein